MSFIDEQIKECEKAYSFENIFHTDNFEDQKHINHPCYAHAGIGKDFKDFLYEALTEYKAKIEAMINDMQSEPIHDSTKVVLSRLLEKLNTL